METEKKYTLYKHVAPDGKVYIGITSTSLKRRWWNGKGYKYNLHFTNAIKKYGWENFQHIVIRDGLTKEQAEIAEIATIRHYNARNPRFGYNMAKGGNTHPASYEGRQRIREASTGKKNPKRGTCNYTPKRKINITEEQIERYIGSNVRKRAVLCVETGIVYRSVREAERQLHLCHSGIARVCNKEPRYITYGGYHWEYVNDYCGSKTKSA